MPRQPPVKVDRQLAGYIHLEQVLHGHYRRHAHLHQFGGQAHVGILTFLRALGTLAGRQEDQMRLGIDVSQLVPKVTVLDSVRRGVLGLQR